MFTLSIETEIAAAHHLRNYDGPCAGQHGHNWKIKVQVKTQHVDKTGITIDFLDLQNISWKVVGKFDHNDFNTIAPFDKINPSAENIAKYFYQEISKLLPDNSVMESLSIWETDKYIVTYSE